MIRVLHVITGLGVGGAEMMLLKLISNMDRTSFVSSVICLTGGSGSRIFQALNRQGVPVFCLDLSRPITLLPRLVQMIWFIKENRPTLLQSWMYHADFVGSLIGLTCKIPVFWNLRQSNLAPSHTKWMTLVLIKFLARVSGKWPHTIVCGSNAARVVHAEMGYCRSKLVVVPNGFSLNRVLSADESVENTRKKIGLDRHKMVIGIVGRFDPQKDFKNFIEAAGILLHSLPKAVFIMCGAGVTRANRDISAWIDAARINDNTILLGERSDVPVLLKLFTILVSSSLGEGFPNIIGEGMAAGVPCIVTDVGDSAYLVGKTGIVVPPENPVKLADAMLKMLLLSDDDRMQIGKRAQDRIVKNFSINTISDAYEQLYTKTAEEKR